MQTPPRRRRVLLLALALLGVLGLGSVLAIDLAVLDEPLLEDGAPLFGPLHLLRTLLIAGSACLLVVSIGRGRSSEVAPVERWDGWGTVALLPDDMGAAPTLEMSAKRLMVWAVMGLALASVTVLAVHPRLFSLACWERGPVEILSALLWFAGCWLLVGVLKALRRSCAGLWPQIAAVSLAGLFFLVGMEEISWGQRVFSFETPALFAASLQGEMNLHNFATDVIESAYYFCSFLALVLVPFVAETSAPNLLRGPLAAFVPTRVVLLCAAVAFAFNYDMWNTLPAQLAFFTTMAVLATYVWWWRRQRRELVVAGALLLTCLLTQATLLAFGARSMRTWDATEYQELFIPLAFVIYAFEVRRLTREASPG